MAHTAIKILKAELNHVSHVSLVGFTFAGFMLIPALI
jgi:hypothetical protein